MRPSNFSRCSLNTIAKRYSSDMAQNYVKRVTLFKVPKPEDIDQASSRLKPGSGVPDLTVMTGTPGV